MHFPVVFDLFGMALPAHLVFETLAYAVGFRLYLWLRRAQADTIGDKTRITVLLGAVVGAALGSKLLGFAEHPDLWRQGLHDPLYFFAAKTILGGLLGGLIGVEMVKAATGIRRSTGDIYVFPLLIAIFIGRIGCLLTGVSDGTWGDATHLVLGFDAGDGVIRHPTPGYEMLFLAGLGLALFIVRQRVKLREGDLFKIFIVAYCAWRFLIEFIKPVTTYSLASGLNIVQNVATEDALWAVPGLSMLQVSALAALGYYAVYFVRRVLGEVRNGHA
ncbi:hypothetical protein AEAC466_03725 [Asticcacaulis sp. AC466]|uniref:prolipoprotein diacylglyceryl transferase family protein n=1 Tax=Asticcacaulis sp. AC466 TaxID=1282362 RepID=UPI0003C3C0D9|nr:prolipoprotein diacylglyceryl transferase family protein [Asticcacaulis sp. AC466]ESQ86319.1 hypothetical protein AEAC466_03725 [Asticcacaulis sp. AC466]